MSIETPDPKTERLLVSFSKKEKEILRQVAFDRKIPQAVLIRSFINFKQLETLANSRQV